MFSYADGFYTPIKKLQGKFSKPSKGPSSVVEWNETFAL
jgi:hypothetical protein